MIMGTEFFDSHVLLIRCMKGVVETTVRTGRLLGRNRHTAEAMEADVDTQRPRGVKPVDPENEALYRSSIRAAQTILVPPITQVPELVYLHLPSFIHKEPKHLRLVYLILKISNGIHVIGPEKPFIVSFYNFSNVHWKIPKQMALGYGKNPHAAHLSGYALRLPFL